MLSLNKHSIIRTIYLYLFALVGLALLIIGLVRFLDMGLKAYVFTRAEDTERISQRYYYSGPISVEKLESCQNNEELTEEEKEVLKGFLVDYKGWKEKEEKIDYLVSKRHREASNNLALIIVGLPLYLYHWRLIKRETKEKEA